MARTKGSKNKASALTVDERIAAVTAELESLQEQVKEKKAQLKKLMSEKDEEDQKRILAAVAASGKTADEVIAMLHGTEKDEGTEGAAE